MIKKMKKITFIFLFFNIFLLAGCNIQKNLASDKVFNYRGKTYTNCYINKINPSLKNKKIEIIKGKAKMEMGSRMYPWLAVSVNDYLLFNAETGKLLDGIDELELNNQILEVKGYKDKGYISMPRYFQSMDGKTIKRDNEILIDKAFYVTEIKNWLNICGYPISESSKKLSESEECLWIKVK